MENESLFEILQPSLMTSTSGSPRAREAAAFIAQGPSGLGPPPEVTREEVQRKSRNSYKLTNRGSVVLGVGVKRLPITLPLS